MYALCSFRVFGIWTVTKDFSMKLVSCSLCICHILDVLFLLIESFTVPGFSDYGILILATCNFIMVVYFVVLSKLKYKFVHFLSLSKPPVYQVSWIIYEQEEPGLEKKERHKLVKSSDKKRKIEMKVCFLIYQFSLSLIFLFMKQ